MRPFVCLAAMAALLAGCAQTTYDFTVDATVPDESFDVSVPLSVTITGGPATHSDHVGGHFWTTPTDDPTGDFASAGGCRHASGGADLPGTITTECTFPSPGDYQVRGHARVDGVDHWSAPHMVHIAVDTAAYTLDGRVPEAPAAGEPFLFLLEVQGPDAQSDHIGAHIWTSSTQDPTGDIAASTSCAHQGGALPGEYDVSCVAEAGTVYIRGHARLAYGDSVYNLWTQEYALTVS